MTGPRGAVGASIDRILAIAKRHAFVTWRSPHRLFDVTMWPVVDVFLFGSIGTFVRSGDTAPGRAAFAYLLCGVVLWHVVYQSQIALSTGVLEETWSRNLLNILVTPAREIEYVAGVALFGLVKLVIGVGLVAVVAATMYSFNVVAVGWELLPVAGVLLLTGWLISLFVIGCVLRFGAGAEAMAWGILFAVLPLSGVFYPVDALPAILRPISLALPTTHAFIAGRSLLDGSDMAWGELGLAFALSGALAIVAVVFVTRQLKTFRVRGSIKRFV